MTDRGKIRLTGGWGCGNGLSDSAWQAAIGTPETMFNCAIGVEVIDVLKVAGEGWQTRMKQAL